MVSDAFGRPEDTVLSLSEERWVKNYFFSSRQQISQPGFSVWIYLFSCVEVLLTVVSLVLAAFFPVFRLPKANGTFAVSYVELECEDHGRPEWLPFWSFDHAEPRNLFTRIWYPVSKKTIDKHKRSVKKASYYPHFNFRGPVQAARYKLPAFVLSHLPQVSCNSYVYAAHEGKEENVVLSLASSSFPWPVVVFSHGYSGTFDQNTYLLENLASHGFIVVAMDHTHDACLSYLPKKGRVVPFNADVPHNIRGIEDLWKLRQSHLKVRTDDMLFIINTILPALNEGKSDFTDPEVNEMFRGKIDLKRIAALGHSFGGATVIDVLAEMGKRRENMKGNVVCGIGLDAWTFPLDSKIKRGGVTLPLLTLQTTKFFSDEPFAKDNDREIESIVYASNRYNPRKNYLVRVHKANHYDFTDAVCFAPIVTTYLWKMTQVSHRFMSKTLEAYCLEFLNTHCRPEEGRDRVGLDPNAAEGWTRMQLSLGSGGGSDGLVKRGQWGYLDGRKSIKNVQVVTDEELGAKVDEGENTFEGSFIAKL